MILWPWRRRKGRRHLTRLGTLLIKHGADPMKIDAAGIAFYERQARLFGEFCVSTGAATRDQLHLALSEQAAERGDYREASRSALMALEELHVALIENLTMASKRIAKLAEPSEK